LFGIERKKKMKMKTKAPLQFQGGDDSKDEVNPSFCSFPTTTTTKNINRTVSYVMSKMHFKVEKSFKIRFLKRYNGI
jgi:hypothetical protein